MNTEASYEIPLPADLSKVISVHDGSKWLNNVVRGSVVVSNGFMSFTIRWNNSKRRITLATDVISGYQVDV